MKSPNRFLISIGAVALFLAFALTGWKLSAHRNLWSWSMGDPISLLRNQVWSLIIRQLITTVFIGSLGSEQRRVFGCHEQAQVCFHLRKEQS